MPNEMGKQGQRARDRILAGCMGLQWMVAQVESARAVMEVVGAAAAEGSEAGAICGGIGSEHREFLDRIADRLTEIVVDVAEYCNGQDMVVPEDEALLTPILDLLVVGTAAGAEVSDG